MTTFTRLLPIFFLITLFSCSTDIGVTETEEEQVEDPKTGTVLNIDYTSLGNVNDHLISIDAPEFTEDELIGLRGIRDEKACLNAKFKGDVNGNDMLSVEDVVILYNAIKEYDDVEKYPDSANGDGRLNVGTEYKGVSPDFWSLVHVAKLVNTDESGQGRSFLERSDIAVIVDLLTGNCE